jgi:hypothetical protein
MAPRISPEKYDKAVRLLNLGKLSTHEIARILDISHSSVNYIRAGSRKRSLARRRSKGSSKKCSICGSPVKDFCVVCRALALRRSQTKPLDDKCDGSDLSLQLKEDDESRYREKMLERFSQDEDIESVFSWADDDC